MNKRIFRSILAAATLVAIACILLMSVVLYSNYFQRGKAEIKNEAGIITAALNENGRSFLSKMKLDEDTRVTLVDPDGTVEFDSGADVSKLDNHADREEIKEAFENGTGESSRLSSTLGKKTIYYAVKLNDGSVIRVSGTAYSVGSVLVGTIAVFAVVTVLIVILCAVLASKLSKSIISPVLAINPEEPEKVQVYDELKPLVNKIATLNSQIKQQMEQLTVEHEAQDKMRREFTANVSHELKTPLTSISGFAEIMRDGLVKQEDISRFAGNIYDEAQRLITLVGDIIKLSQLDENAVPTPKEPIDIFEICNSVISHLKSTASKRNVTIELTGCHAVILGVEQIIDEVVYNLCDNAIKYNVDGGSVTVNIERNNNNVVLSVSDTGIGIEQENIDRIFERFYRVNKSHSKEIGGTGLGLSIVKHGVAYHNASVSVDSEPGKGTKVSIIFETTGNVIY